MSGSKKERLSANTIHRVNRHAFSRSSSHESRNRTEKRNMSVITLCT